MPTEKMPDPDMLVLTGLDDLAHVPHKVEPINAAIQDALRKGIPVYAKRTSAAEEEIDLSQVMQDNPEIHEVSEWGNGFEIVRDTVRAVLADTEHGQLSIDVRVGGAVFALDQLPASISQLNIGGEIVAASGCVPEVCLQVMVGIEHLGIIRRGTTVNCYVDSSITGGTVDDHEFEKQKNLYEYIGLVIGHHVFRVHKEKRFD